jgi:hypothetical protein
MSKNPASRPSDGKKPAWRRIPKLKPPMFSWRTHDPTASDNGGNSSLIAELVTYKKNLDLVIKGDQILGYYPDAESGEYAAAMRFGTEPALVKEIVEFEQYVTFGGIY